MTVRTRNILLWVGATLLVAGTALFITLDVTKEAPQPETVAVEELLPDSEEATVAEDTVETTTTDTVAL